MKKKLIGILICLLLIATMIPLNATSNPIQNNIIYVDDDNIYGPWDGSIEYPFKYVQDGINKSLSGDIVFVNNGYYVENLIISRNIHLTGEDKESTVIDGNGNIVPCEHCITINCSNVIISGFTITNGNDGILLWTSDNSNSQVYDNIIIYNRFGIIDLEGNSNTFFQNDIKSICSGIVLRECSNDIIIKNNISNCGTRSIFIIKGRFNVINNNNLINEDDTIFIDDSFNNKILYNNIVQETPSERYFRIDGFQLCFNIWHKNYWNDWTNILPRPIHGESRTYLYPDGGQRKIPWINFDLNPVLKPYDILL